MSRVQESIRAIFTTWLSSKKTNNDNNNHGDDSFDDDDATSTTTTTTTRNPHLLACFLQIGIHKLRRDYIHYLTTTTLSNGGNGSGAGGVGGGGGDAASATSSSTSNTSSPPLVSRTLLGDYFIGSNSLSPDNYYSSNNMTDGSTGGGGGGVGGDLGGLENEEGEEEEQENQNSSMSKKYISLSKWVIRIVGLHRIVEVAALLSNQLLTSSSSSSSSSRNNSINDTVRQAVSKAVEHYRRQCRLVERQLDVMISGGDQESGCLIHHVLDLAKSPLWMPFEVSVPLVRVTGEMKNVISDIIHR